MEKYYVYIFIDGLYQKCALLSYDGQAYRMAYGTKYLKRQNAIPIDPINLPLYEKTYESETIFGAIKDCSPDRWGRYLLDKRFNRSLTEMEYILANNLDHVGSLAFSPYDSDTPLKLTPGGYSTHIHDQISLDTIINQTEIAIMNEENSERLQELLNYGPSLGGARPKYSINLKGKSYLAKYSTSQDSRREPLIEFASMSMAKSLGLNVPEIKVGKIAGRDVFYIKRFDREKNEKHPFVSALSLCGWDENGYQSWSYPVLCEALIKIGKNQQTIKQDLQELFRRIAFNIAINNNDDHPKNHGVLFKEKTWRLSPLYDVVPMDSKTQSFSLAMEIGLHQRQASKSNLLSICEHFQLQHKLAEKLIDEIFIFVAGKWKHYFKKAGLNAEEIQRFSNAMSTKL